MRRKTLQLAAVRMARPVRALALACALLAFGLAVPAQAADKYWSGAGTWNAANSNWGAAPGGPYNTTFATGDVAHFEGTAGTVTVSAPNNPSGIYFDVDGYTLSGGTITLNANCTITTGAGTDTIGSIIAGAGLGITKAGSGTLVLSGANTFTGTATLNAGTLRATTSAQALGTGAATLTLAGGTLELANDTALSYSRNTTVSGTVTIKSERLTSGAGVTHTLGTLSLGAYTLSVDKDATVTSGTQGLTFGATTLTGGATINTAAGALTTTTTVGGAGQNLTIGGAGNTTISGVISTTTGRVTKSDGGTLTLSGANTFTGGLYLNGGNLVATVAGAFGTNANTLYFGGGNLELRAAATTFTGNLDATGADVAITINPAASGAGVTHTISGAAALGGRTATVSAGSLATSNTAYGLTLSGASTLSGSPAFTINGNGTATGTVTLSGGFNTGGTARTVTFNSGTGTSAAAISGAFAGTASTLELAGTTPAVTVGALTGATAHAVQVSGTGTYTFNGASTFTGGVILNNASAAVIATVGGGFGATSGNVKFNVAGTGFELRSDGATTFTTGLDASAYGGTITVNRATSSATATTHTMSLASTFGGNTITVSAGSNITSGTAYGLTLSGTAAFTGTNTFAVNNNGAGVGTMTFSNTVSGTASVVKSGAGTLALNGTNSYTGTTTINAGTVSAATLANGGSNSGIGCSASDAANLVINGGTLQYTGGTVSTDRNFTIGASGGAIDSSGSGALTLSGAPTMAGSGDRTLTLTGTNTNTNTFSSAIGSPSSGNVSLTKAGAGKWAIANSTVTIGGNVLISAGTLVSTSGTLTVSGNFTNNGTFTHNSGTVTFNGTTTASGTLTGSSNRFNIVIVTGTVTAGAALEAAGTFTLSGSYSTGTSPGPYYNLTVGGAFSQTAGTFAGGAATSVDLNGTCTLSGGTFTSTSGTLYVQGNYDATAGGAFAHNGGTVRFDRGYGYSQTMTVGSELYNHVEVWNNGAGTSNSHTVVGTMDVRGNLTLGSAATWGGLLYGGTITVYGDLTMAANSAGMCDTNDARPTLTIKLIGTTDQTITTSPTSPGHFPSITIDKPSGTVNLVGTIYLHKDWIWTRAGGLNAGTSTLYVYVTYAYLSPAYTTLTPGPFTYNNVTFDHQSNSNIHASDTMNVAGNVLAISRNYGDSGCMTGGTVAIGGNLTVSMSGSSYFSSAGTTDFVLTGGGTQSISQDAGVRFPGGRLVAQKTGGSAALATDLVINQGTQDIVVNQGILDLNGKNITAKRFLQVDAAGTLKLQGAETATVSTAPNTPTLNDGSLVWFYGTSGPYSVTTLSTAYSDLKIDGAGTTFTTGPVVSCRNLNISAGTFAPGGTVSVAGDFSNSATFTHNNWTVIFTAGTGASTIAGNTNFYNLSCTTAGKQLTFTAGTTQIISGSLALLGSSTNMVKLRSTGGGTPRWTLNLASAQTVQYVDVQDGGCDTSDATVYNGTNNGGNDDADGSPCWVFATATGARYWVGGAGSWSDDTNHWALTSGGTPVAGNKPGAGHSAVFDSNSAGICLVDEAVNVKKLALVTGTSSELKQNGYNITVGADGFAQAAGTFTGTAAGTLSIAGNFIYNGGTFTHGSGTITFNGTSCVLGGSTATFFNVTITGTLSGAAAICLDGTWTNNGTFAASGNSVTFTGTTTPVAVTGSQPTTFYVLNLGTTLGAAQSKTIGIGHSTAGSALTTTATTLNVGSTSQTTGTTTVNLGNNGSGNNTVAQALTVTGTLTINKGSTGGGTLVSVATGSLNHAITVGGNWTNNKAFTANSGTVTLNGSATQTVGGTVSTTFNNLTLSNNVTRQFGDATTGTRVFTVSGVFTWSDGNIQVGQGGLTDSLTLAAASVTVPAGRSLTTVGASPFNVNSAAGASGITIPAGGTLALGSGGSSITCGGNWTNNNTFTHGNGSVTLNSAGTQTVGGTADTTFYNLTLSNNGTRQFGDATTGGRTFTVAGAFTWSAGSIQVGQGALTDTLTLAAATVTIPYLSYNYTFGLTTVGAASVVNINGAAGTSGINIASGGTLVLINGFTPVSCAGDWVNNGTLTAGTAPVTFTATAVGRTLSGNLSGASAFALLTFNGTGGGWSASSALAVTYDLTMTAGTLSGTNDITVNRHVAGTDGVIALTGGTFEQRMGAAVNFGTTANAANWSFNNLTFSNSGGAAYTVTTQTGGSGTITVAGALTLGRGTDSRATTLDAGNRTWILNKAGTPFVVTGSPAATLTPSTSKFSYAGAADQAVASANYYNLDVNISGGAKATIGFNLTTTNVANALTISGSSLVILTGGINLPGKAVTFTGTGELRASGDLTDLGTFTKASGKVTLNGGVAQSIAGTLAPAFHDLTITNSSTVTLNVDATVDATTLKVDAGSSLAVAAAKALTLLGGVSLDGTLELKPNATLKTAADITGNAGSTFKVSGTGSGAGNYGIVQGNGGVNYAMTLNGNVSVSYAHIDHLSTAGLTLSSSAGTKTFANVTFGSGQVGAGPYLTVANSYWSGQVFDGMSFANVGGGRKSVRINTVAADQVLLSNYDTGGLSGDGSDMDSTSGGGVGSVRWVPTAADGLTAAAERVKNGTLVSWRAPVERGTLGYRVLRWAPGPADQAVKGGWQKVAEVPVAAFGAEPAGRAYRWLDESASPAGGQREYRVEEIETGGEEPKAAVAQRVKR